jgi:hypothetical protein
MTEAEAGARLDDNALNPLAHGGQGLDGALRIAAECRRFDRVTWDLTATCPLVIAALAQP